MCQISNAPLKQFFYYKIPKIPCFFGHSHGLNLSKIRILNHKYKKQHQRSNLMSWPNRFPHQRTQPSIFHHVQSHARRGVTSFSNRVTSGRLSKNILYSRRVPFSVPSERITDPLWTTRQVLIRRNSGPCDFRFYLPMRGRSVLVRDQKRSESLHGATDRPSTWYPTAHTHTQICRCFYREGIGAIFSVRRCAWNEQKLAVMCQTDRRRNCLGRKWRLEEWRARWPSFVVLLAIDSVFEQFYLII